jgi:hypothetical protein
MLKLSHNQIERLSKPIVDKFFNKAVSHVIETWSVETETIDKQTLNTLVADLIEQAYKIGLLMEYDILRYLDVSFATDNCS